jgi:hypothetical protein
LAYPAIPNLFDEIFTAGAFAMDGVDLTDANTDYFRDEDDKTNERPKSRNCSTFTKASATSA